MLIILLGYMGSGKSTVGRLLSKKLGYGFVDFDEYIEEKQRKSISQIFDQKGEVFFRKLEQQYLIEILNNSDNRVVSLGGGTPCYGDNMDRIVHADAQSVYFNVPVAELTARLWQARMHRPLLRHQDTPEKLSEFVRKHLFERSFYYNRADIKIAVDGKSELELVHELIARLF